MNTLTTRRSGDVSRCSAKQSSLPFHLDPKPIYPRMMIRSRLHDIGTQDRYETFLYSLDAYGIVDLAYWRDLMTIEPGSPYYEWIMYQHLFTLQWAPFTGNFKARFYQSLNRAPKWQFRKAQWSKFAARYAADYLNRQHERNQPGDELVA